MLYCRHCRGQMQFPLTSELLPQVLLLFGQVKWHPETQHRYISRLVWFEKTRNGALREQEIFISTGNDKDLYANMKEPIKSSLICVKIQVQIHSSTCVSDNQNQARSVLPHLAPHPTAHHQQAPAIQILGLSLVPEKDANFLFSLQSNFMYIPQNPDDKYNHPTFCRYPQFKNKIKYPALLLITAQKTKYNISAIKPHNLNRAPPTIMTYDIRIHY